MIIINALAIHLHALNTLNRYWMSQIQADILVVLLEQLPPKRPLQTSHAIFMHRDTTNYETSTSLLEQGHV